MINHFKVLYLTPTRNFTFLLVSIFLSVLPILLGESILYTLPVIVIIVLSFIYGERFILAIILVSLFTLVREVSESLRATVHFVNFSLLGYLFLKRFGLKFNLYPRIPKSLVYFLVLYCLAMILSALMSSYPSAGIGMISRQIAFFIVVYVLYSLINDEADIKNYFIAIIFVAFILVIISLASFFFEGYSLVEIVSKNRVRVSALITNIEASTNFYVISFPLVTSALLIKKETLNKIVSWFMLFYFSLGLTLTMSRSAILGIVISTAIIFYMLRRKRFYQFVFALIALVLLFLLYEPLNETISLLFRIEEGMSARDHLWTMSLNMIRDHPVFGIGPGAYRYEMFNYFPFMLDNWWGKVFIEFYIMTEGANLSHNYFLVFFTEMGILGIITAITLPVIYFRIGIKTINKYKNESADKYYLIIALFAAGTSVIMRNFFNSIGLLYVGGITTDLPFWLIFGSLVYFYQAPLTANSAMKDQHQIHN